MTTATAPKRKVSPLEEYHELGAVERERADEASSLSTELSEKHRTLFGQGNDYRGLIDNLQAIRQQDPEQFEPDGVTPRKGTDAAKISAAIEALSGELSELQPRVEHARRREAKARRDRAEFGARNFAAIAAGLRPEFAALRDDLDTWAAEGPELASRYHGLVGRVLALREGDPALHGLRVPGQDRASDLLKSTAALRDSDWPDPTSVEVR